LKSRHCFSQLEHTFLDHGFAPPSNAYLKAEELDIPVIRKFLCEGLGKQLAHNNKQGDLFAGNKVYAHVPDINDFTRGLKTALKLNGTITLEFPNLLSLSNMLTMI